MLPPRSFIKTKELYGMKRFLSIILIILLLGAAFPAGAERTSIPEALRFTQKTTARDYVRDQQYIVRTYPTTANETVNGEMRALIDRMAEAGRSSLPKGKIVLHPSYLDVGATISRTGSQWMSFLTIAHIAYEREQTYVDFDARVYDMVTGEQLTLSDLFDEDSPAWELLAQEVRRQLGEEYFMTLSPDAAALDALCVREALENASFTLTPAKLELHYRADALYPGKQTLMHVKVYYSALRPLMNAKGQEITDNSQYKMVALTYDDGGARGQTNNVVSVLRNYGASATFFIVGERMADNHDVMCRQQDAGYALASHNYEHVYTGVTVETVAAWRERFNAEMDSIIGIRPAYIRAPGGHDELFTEADVQMPVIHWTLNSKDADTQKDNAKGVAQFVIGNVKDGSVVLMHDLNPLAREYTEEIVDTLENSFLFVTVDELFDHYGVTLEPNKAYLGCTEEAAAR